MIAKIIAGASSIIIFLLIMFAIWGEATDEIAATIILFIVICGASVVVAGIGE